MPPYTNEIPWGLPFDDDDTDTDTDSDSESYTSESESESEYEIDDSMKLPQVGLDKDMEVVVSHGPPVEEGEEVAYVVRRELFRVEVIAETEADEEVVLFTKHFKRKDDTDEYAMVPPDGIVEDLLRKKRLNGRLKPANLPLKKTIMTLRKTSFVVKITELKLISYVMTVNKQEEQEKKD